MSDKSKRKLFVLVVLLFFATLLILSRFYSINIISGESMYPTFKNNSIFISKKDNNNIDIGDIAVFKTPEDWDDPNKLLIKRVLAKEGDNIKIKNDKLYINNQFVLEVSNDYYRNNDKSFNIDKGYYFVVGDNTPTSRDSLFYMLNYSKVNFLIPKDNIVGIGKKDSKKKEIDKYVKAYNK